MCLGELFFVYRVLIILVSRVEIIGFVLCLVLMILVWLSGVCWMLVVRFVMSENLRIFMLVLCVVIVLSVVDMLMMWLLMCLVICILVGVL